MRPADIQLPGLFESDQDRALGNVLSSSKDPIGGLVAPVVATPRLLNPVIPRPLISFGLG